MARVVLAMSGGVDSSVAAHLLLEAGHEVIGVFMRHGETSPVACATGERGGVARESSGGRRLPVVSPRLDHKQGCCSAADAEDGRRVADRLGIPFYALNLEQEFGRIIDYFVDQYTSGRTPNPCVMCNNWIKFGKLFDYADGIGAEFVATGHYARLETTEAGGDRPHPGPLPEGEGENTLAPALLRGRDAGKDQSYVLFGIRRDLLRRMLLPVGHYDKRTIRGIAAELGLRVADKKDSQEICFVTSGQHDEFIRRRRHDEGVTPADSDAPGEIVTTDGTVVGTHRGVESFTIGQRKGLGVALGEPRFVVRIEPQTRRVVIGTKEELARRELTAAGTNWLIGEPAGEFRCAAQIRYNSVAAPALAEVLPGDRLRVAFDEPCYGVAPGQAVVLYDGERVLGGGWID